MEIKDAVAAGITTNIMKMNLLCSVHILRSSASGESLVQ